MFARGGATVGIGAGQMSRVDSVRIAAQKAAEAAANAGLAEPPTRGSVVASDAFYPFADGLEAAIAAGATAAIQPGGSRRDARGHRRRRPRRDRDGVHRHPPFPALIPPALIPAPASASWRSQLRNARPSGRSSAPGAVTM